MSASPPQINFHPPESPSDFPTATSVSNGPLYHPTGSSSSSSSTTTTLNPSSSSSSSFMNPLKGRLRSSSSPQQAVELPTRPTTISRHQSHLHPSHLSPKKSGAGDADGSESGGGAAVGGGAVKRGRARSASLVTVKQVGGGEGEVDSADMANGDPNWEWVDSKGAWIIHPMLILLGKFLIDAIPGIGPDISWTFVNCTYMAISYLIFHQMTGLPFETQLTTGGAFDDLTLWEQIDNGAQYTPARKWLTSVPIGLFLISTHYTNYNPVLFAINIIALAFAIVPKLPILHRLRFQFLQPAIGDTPAVSPKNSRPSSPVPPVRHQHLPGVKE